MKYKEEEPGVWIFPKRRFYKMACCDCGLVHKTEFRLKGKHIEFRMWRDERATSQIRRYIKLYKDNPSKSMDLS